MLSDLVISLTKWVNTVIRTGHVSVQTSPSHSGRREKLINEIFLKKSLVAATHCSQTKQQIASTAQTKKKEHWIHQAYQARVIISDTPLPNFAKERISHQPVTNITPMGSVFEYHNQVNNRTTYLTRRLA
jgi:hypothetical protein